MGNKIFKRRSQSFWEALFAPIQICRSCCTSASIYIIAGARASLGVEFHSLRMRADPGSRSKESKVAESNALEVLLPYLMASLSNAMALLGMENLFGWMKIAKLYKRFI